MTDALRPLLVIPKSPQVARTFAAELLDELAASPRAAHAGLVVILPRAVTPSALMAACQLWPAALRSVGITRVAIVLGVSAYVVAEPLLASCQRKMAEQGIAVAYFHEGHLESDQISAWFQQRKSRRRVTTDALMKLSVRYAERGDTIAANHAAKLAELAGEHALAA